MTEGSTIENLVKSMELDRGIKDMVESNIDNFSVIEERFGAVDDRGKYIILIGLVSFVDREEVKHFVVEQFEQMQEDENMCNFFYHINGLHKPFVPSLLKELYGNAKKRRTKDFFCNAVYRYGWDGFLEIMKEEVAYIESDEIKTGVLQEIGRQEQLHAEGKTGFLKHPADYEKGGKYFD